MDEDSLTDVSQESRIMVGEIRDSEVSASSPNLENTNQETPITNPNSNEQSSNISRDQLQEFLNTVMQDIKAESAKQTAAKEEFRKQTAAGQEEAKKQNTALQEEFKKQTALLKEESAKSTTETAKLAAESTKLASAVESLKSEIKEENDRLAKSLTTKFEAAHTIKLGKILRLT
jgi:hypothetical protein